MNKGKFLIVLFFLCFTHFYLFAQINKENLRFGHEAYNNGDFYSACYYFSKVIETEPENIEVAYSLADASRLSLAYKDAEKWYLFVKDKSNSKDFPLLKFYLGKIGRAHV